MELGFLKPHAERIYALMRIFAGLLFMQHGLQKIFGLFVSGEPQPMPAFVQYGAGSIELIGGALVALGLFAAPAAFIASGSMAAAYFMAHASNGFFPIVNKGELAVLYCWVFFFIAVKGSGIWSVDAARGGAAS
jgi:putative oxidoreductase